MPCHVLFQVIDLGDCSIAHFILFVPAVYKPSWFSVGRKGPLQRVSDQISWKQTDYYHVRASWSFIIILAHVYVFCEFVQHSSTQELRCNKKFTGSSSNTLLNSWASLSILIATRAVHAFKFTCHEILGNLKRPAEFTI